MTRTSACCNLQHLRRSMCVHNPLSVRNVSVAFDFVGKILMYQKAAYLPIFQRINVVCVVAPGCSTSETFKFSGSTFLAQINYVAVRVRRDFPKNIKTRNLQIKTDILQTQTTACQKLLECSYIGPSSSSTLVCAVLYQFSSDGLTMKGFYLLSVTQLLCHSCSCYIPSSRVFSLFIR